MASTYTSNLGVEKPEPGDRPNTWGNMVNANMNILDRALGGRETITKASSDDYGQDNPKPLDISDTGALSDGHYPAIEYADDGDLGADLYVQLTPNTAERTITFRNSLTNDRNLVVFQGTYASGRAYTVPNGYDATLVFDGGTSTATVTRLVEKQSFEELDTTAIAQTTREMLGNIFYPVGSIYISTSATNPGNSQSMGFGTWVRFAEGKTLFSQSDDAEDTEFSSSQQTGGSKTIDVANLPEHSHGPGTLGGSTNTTGNHRHSYSDIYATGANSEDGNSGNPYGLISTTTRNTNTGSAGGHSHTVDVNAGNTGATGEGAVFLPPYITVYMWKREA